ncbi:uncharacterized protein LOC134240617 [Saccostrea cucullata]|uniref:uncharacterized protein LOC134240617 n=1 Tax=Saccostrea cuccullata TaxID=36930 RepID=UPI002ED224C9
MDEVLCRLSKEVQNRNKRIVQIYGGRERAENLDKKVIVIVFDGSNEFDFDTWEGYPLKWKQWRCPPDEGAIVSGREKSESFDEVKVYEIESLLRDHARLLFKNHSNLEVSSISAYRSQQNGNILEKQWCIALYCSCKGVVPLSEEEFPSSIEGCPTDIREGFFYWFPNNTGKGFSKNPKDVLQPLVMGCSIGGKDKNLEGTLGGFVSFENGAGQERGFITTAHTFFDQPQTSSIEIVQPSYGIQNENNVCGVHVKSVFPTQQDQYGVSVDASLIKLTERFPDRGTFSGYTVADLSILGFSKEKPPEYDTDEIRDYRNNKHVNERGNACCKSGTSSGFTKGYLKLNGLAVKYHDPSIPFSNSPSFCGFHYYSQLEINHLKGLKDFAQAGDSGALVFQIDPQGCDKDDKLVCIGMVVGGTSFGTTVVTPIASVLDELKVKFLPLKLEAMEC